MQIHQQRVKLYMAAMETQPQQERKGQNEHIQQVTHQNATLMALLPVQQKIYELSI